MLRWCPAGRVGSGVLIGMLRPPLLSNTVLASKRRHEVGHRVTAGLKVACSAAPLVNGLKGAEGA